MQTKSPLYALDQWNAPAAPTAAKKGKGKEIKCIKEREQNMPSNTNLLGNGVAAAAKYINTFGKINPNMHEEDM